MKGSSVPIKLTATDKANLTVARTNGNPWKHLHDNFSNTQKKIKDYLKAINDPCCCYCKRKISFDNNSLWDAEHVLPQAKYPKYVFHFRNLNVSCKRCNSAIKREDDSFFNKSTKIFSSKNYTILHPNLDIYHEHMEIIEINYNGNDLLLYKVLNKSKKGNATYTYFRLHDLVVDEIQDAQGMKKKVTFDQIEQMLSNL